MVPRFRTNAGKSAITVPEVSVRHYFDDKGKNKNISKREWFVNQLTQRGFSVNFECEDRPCYFIVEIPEKEKQNSEN